MSAQNIEALIRIILWFLQSVEEENEMLLIMRNILVD
jgi:hypothetical protein